MRDKATFAFVGWTVGLVCFAFYLVVLALLGIGRQSFYWMMPFPNEMQSSMVDSVFEIQLKVILLWQYSRFELVATLLGMLFPIALTAAAWCRAGNRAGNRDATKWRRWYNQVLLSGLNLAALSVIISGIKLVLP